MDWAFLNLVTFRVQLHWITTTHSSSSVFSHTVSASVPSGMLMLNHFLKECFNIVSGISSRLLAYILCILMISSDGLSDNNKDSVFFLQMICKWFVDQSIKVLSLFCLALRRHCQVYAWAGSVNYIRTATWLAALQDSPGFRFV